MNTPPATTDLDPRDIERAIARHWGIDVERLTYMPLGFGSHHWLADLRGSSVQALFVTADQVAPGSAAEGALRSALTAAWHLRHRAGIAAVVAPLHTRAGEILVPVNVRWVVALYPHVQVEKSEWGEYTNEEDRRRAQQLVALVHSVDPSTLPKNAPPVEDFAIPYQAELFERLAAANDRWDAGPYAEQAQLALMDNAERIRAGFTLYDALVDRARASQGDWVVTHGEPHAGNIIRRANREDMVMVDWDTCALAPRERDLWQLVRANHSPVTELVTYVASAGLSESSICAERLALYRLRWDLAEIAIYADDFFNDHEDTEDTRIAWGGLKPSIEKLEHHLR